MDDNKKIIEKEILLIDGEPDETEILMLNEKINEYLNDYADRKDKPVKTWLTEIISRDLPKKSESEINNIVADICEQDKANQENLESLNQYINNGKTKEAWFADRMEEYSSLVGAEKIADGMNSIYRAFDTACSGMLKVIFTNKGEINSNPSLDGFIAEQHHTNIFNIRAAAKNSSLRARVLQAGEHGYNKNSVDIVIEDLSKSGHDAIKRRYQAKYYRNAKETAKAFENGSYNGQRKLVPSDQVETIKENGMNVVDRIKCGNIESDPYSKSEAINDRESFTKSDNINKTVEDKYNPLKRKEIVRGLVKAAGKAAAIGAVIKSAFKTIEIIKNKRNGIEEENPGTEIAKAAIEGGADAGVRVAIAGAVKAVAEKIGRKLTGNACANIAFIGIEEAKIANKVAKGELSPIEALDKSANAIISVAAGTVVAQSSEIVGGEIGAAIGAIGGPVGMAIGGVIGVAVGGIVGFAAGEKIGNKFWEGTKRIAEKAKPVVKSMWDGAKKVGEKIGNLFRNRAFS